MSIDPVSIDAELVDVDRSRQNELSLSSVRILNGFHDPLTMSRRSRRPLIAVNTSLTCFNDPISHPSHSAFPFDPSFAHSSVIFAIAASPVDLSSLTMITWHPIFANQREHSKPMPVEPPVTTATLPVRSVISGPEGPMMAWRADCMMSGVYPVSDVSSVGASGR